MHALDHHVERLAQDHARAARLADALRDLPDLIVSGQPTTMVFIDMPPARLAAFKANMDATKVRMSIGYLPHIRMVLHLDVDDDAIERTIVAFRSFFATA